jgi:glycosyltransferase involved in cell wall biosynthesis
LGFDLNRWIWNKKLKYWKHPIEVVTPSKWLSGCVRSSLIMKGWPCKVIPNPIDTDFWSPLDAETCRQLMKLPLDKKLIGFGALGGSHAHHKGFDLLKEAILKIRNLKSPNELGLVVLGQSKPLVPPELGFPIYYVGHLHDELSIKILYNCLDVFVIPSRNDNLPNMAVEAQACGVPVVGFDIGGVSDIVDNNVTGYLAKPFDIEDLSSGIIGVLDAGRTSKKIKEIHEITKQKFSYSSISMKYIAKYKEIISSCNVA